MSKKLSIRDERFCNEFIITGGNAVESARRAGYRESTATKQAFAWVGQSRHNSSKPHLWDRVTELREGIENEYRVSQGVVLRGIYRIADSDPANLYNDFGDILPIQDIEENTRKAIAGIEYYPNGSVKKIKLGDRNTAWANIAKMLGYNAAEAIKHDLGESFLDFLKKATAANGE